MTKHLKRMLSTIAAAAVLAPTMSLGVSAAGYPSTYNYSASSAASSIVPGKANFSVLLSEERTRYVLHDQTRNIKIVSATLNSTTGDTPNVNDIVAFSKTEKPTSVSQFSAQALATLYQVQRIYDLFKQNGYSNFGSGSNGTLYITLDTNTGEASVSYPSGYSWLRFGQKASSNAVFNYMAADEDIVGHELAHIMLNKKMGWTSSLNNGEVKAIMEAYCDIFGELFDSNMNWVLGSDAYVIKPSSSSTVYSIRDLRNPSATQSPSYYYKGRLIYNSNNYFTDYQAFKKSASSVSALDSESGSTVLSHAAYKMYSRGISKSLLTQIWMRSLEYLTYFNKATGVNFSDVRQAVVVAANSILFEKNYAQSTHKNYINIINTAFDEANIPAMGYTTETLARSMNPTNMADFIRFETRKYPNGKYWCGGDIEKTTTTPSSTLENKIIVNTTFDRGLNKSFNYEVEEPYYECAGFAKKLQMDYFGTTKFLHLDIDDKTYQYEPRVGDHLRIKLGETSTGDDGAHSIFITGVSTNSNGVSTITYTDCNSDGNNIIQWNKTGSYYPAANNGGKDCFMIGRYRYNVLWVERPMVLGDVNGDSYLNSSDTTMLQTMINRGSSYTAASGVDLNYRKFIADVNKDGKITSADKTLLTNQMSGARNLSFVK